MKSNMTMILDLLNDLNERTIVYRRSYASMVGSVTGGVALSQLMYWYVAKNGEGF